MTRAGGPLVEILRAARVVLIDFDGPICALFSGYPAPAAAEELRKMIAANGGEMPMEVATARGPFHVLSLVSDACPPAVARVAADALRDIEVTATESAAATPGADELLRVVHDTGRRVAVVSNNSVQAVRTYLERHDLGEFVDHINARDDGMSLRLLKPSPHLVDQALVALDMPPCHAVLVGDSTTDIAAGRAAGVGVIGYANKPGKRAALRDAGAAAVVDTLAELSSALRAA